MADKLTWDEIKGKYPDEWVVLVDYELDPDEEVTAGTVLAHSRNKADLKQALSRPDDAAFLYTGDVQPVAGVMVKFDGAV
jgi:hypothetical protein